MKPFMIGIGGPSCSGKTTLATRLAQHLHAPVINLDSYYRDLAHLSLEDRARTNFDHPESLEEALLAEHLTALHRGESIAVPRYDFATHSRIPGEYTTIAPQPFIIMEGLFVLHWPAVRDSFDLRIYMDVADPRCFTRRKDRDTVERGRTPESVDWQYAETVRPMAEQFILPTREHADLILDGTAPVEGTAATVLETIRTMQR
ncbi:MAG TPA: uridine kinase [Terriglobales bacterium]